MADNKDHMRKYNIKKRKGFILFVEEHYERLYRYGFTITDVEYIVEDSVQDAFLILWKKRKEIRDSGAAFFYLMRTLKTKIIRSLKECRKYLPIDAIPPDKVAYKSSEEAWIAHESIQEKYKVLHQHLSALPQRQRKIIVLHFLEHKSFDEITTIMNIGRQSAYNLLSRSLKNLKSKF